jgi:hypothetical protein
MFDRCKLPALLGATPLFDFAALYVHRFLDKCVNFAGARPGCTYWPGKCYYLHMYYIAWGSRMRCPACGYPNEEEASICFSCNARIEGSAPRQKTRPSFIVGPETQKKGYWLRKSASERWEIWLIASVILIVSVLLPWESAFYRDTLTNAPVLTVSANLFSLVLADDIIVSALALIFLIGLLLSMVLPRLIVIPIGAMVLLVFTMPEYVLSQLPSIPPNSEQGFYTNSAIGFGYILAWLALVVVGTLVLKDSEVRFQRRWGKDQTPSEDREPNDVSWFWRWGGGGGQGGGP